ncbi:MAG: SMI1/KNR4 family protein, partial [Gemmataceae bacterium]|nr:SMI1/KNR4 family protein [Gemmataceae bacterium]
PASLVGAFGLMSAQEIADELAERKAGTEGPWEEGWIPLLSDQSGDLVCLDTTRPGHPLVETWRGRPKAEDAAPSLEAWLGKLLAESEAGHYVEDEERGEYHRKG